MPQPTWHEINRMVVQAGMDTTRPERGEQPWFWLLFFDHDRHTSGRNENCFLGGSLVQAQSHPHALLVASEHGCNAGHDTQIMPFQADKLSEHQRILFNAVPKYVLLSEEEIYGTGLIRRPDER